MNEPEVDPRRLAALLDGRLDERERRALLDELAASDDALALYGDAAAVLREIESDTLPAPGPEGDDATARHVVASKEGQHTTSPPSARPARGGAHEASTTGRRRSFRTARWVAVAATVAAVAVVPMLWQRTQSGDGAPAYVAQLSTPDTGLPLHWNGTPWATTRGPADPLPARARGVRIGARLADLELLARARDARAAKVAAELAVLLDEVPGSGPAVAVLDTIRALAVAGAVVAPTLLATGHAAATAVAGTASVALGAWVEAARIAARQRDAAFFRRPASRAALARARSSPEVETTTPGLAERLGRLPAPDDARGWQEIDRELTALLGALGS